MKKLAFVEAFTLNPDVAAKMRRDDAKATIASIDKQIVALLEKARAINEEVATLEHQRRIAEQVLAKDMEAGSDRQEKTPSGAREMICLRADGTEIERRPVSAYKRFSMQAAGDHREANKAKRELGDQLDRVTFVWTNGHASTVTLAFDVAGNSLLAGREFGL